DLRELGLLYYVGASSKTLGDAWRRGARYTSVVNEGLSLRYVERQAVTMAFEYVGVPRHIDRQQIEFSMTALVQLCRKLTGGEVAPTRASFTHRRHEDASELAAYFACDVEFGAPADQTIFDATFKALPIVTADRHLNELLIAYGEEALTRRSMNR